MSHQATEGLIKALEDIAGPRSCGCHPVCNCNHPDNIEIERDWMRDRATEALEAYRNTNKEDAP